MRDSRQSGDQDESVARKRSRREPVCKQGPRKQAIIAPMRRTYDSLFIYPIRALRYIRPLHTEADVGRLPMLVGLDWS
jgi:hypothetical protein